MNTYHSILVIEDSLQDFLILKEYISRADSFQVKIFHAKSVEEARVISANETIDLVFLDLFLPDSFGKETFINVSAQINDVPIIVLSGLIDKSLALNIVQMGAQDYIVKGEFDELLIEKSITYSIERHKNQKRLEHSEKRYRLTFENAAAAMIEYDASELFQFIEELKKQGKEKSYFNALDADEIEKISKSIKVISINPEVLKMFGFKSRKDFEENRYKIITEESKEVYSTLSKAIWDRKRNFKSIHKYLTLEGKELTVLSRFTLYDFENNSCKIVRSGIDITMLIEKERQIERQQLLAEKLSEASLELLKKEEPVKLLNASIEILGKELSLDVISVAKINRTKEAHLKLVTRWCSNEKFDDKALTGFYNSPIREHPFYQGVATLDFSKINEFNDESEIGIPETLKEKGVKNLLVAPIMQKDSLWAVMFFLSASEERRWREPEKLLVKSYSNAVGSFLIKIQAEKELYNLNNQLETRIEKRTEQLTEALEELESFSYSVSHDLRAPLRKVAGFSQILDKEYGPDLPERAHHLLGNIKSGATEMTHLIHDLLEFSKLGQRSISLNKIPMNDLCSEIIKSTLESYPRLDVSVKLPELENAMGDVTLVKHVLNNLIWNAVKFSSKKEKVQIEFNCEKKDDYYHYSIKDNGIGIDMQYANKIFAVFQRLHTKEEYEGTGVGLAIVNRIIKKHGGKVSVAGEPDKGCTFTFSLPATTEAYQLNIPSNKSENREVSLTTSVSS